MLIPFDKTLNLDVMQFIDRTRMAPRPDGDFSTEEKAVYLAESSRRLTDGRVLYKNGSRTFTLRLLQQRLEAGPDLLVYCDSEYLDGYLDRDRNIVTAEGCYLFDISYKQVRMIDINQLRDIDRNRWSSLLCSGKPGLQTCERVSVSIFVDHRDNALTLWKKTAGTRCSGCPRRTRGLQESSKTWT